MLCKNPFFLFLGAYIRASEVTSRCKTPQKHNPGIYLVPLCLKVPHLTSRSCAATTFNYVVQFILNILTLY